MTDDTCRTYTVIGVYAEDHQRFAHTFEDVNPGGAEDQAAAWAHEQDGSPEIIIAGVAAGAATMADAGVGADPEPESPSLIRIVFGASDVEGMAEEARIPLATAMSRAEGWCRAIEETATALCSSQLLSVVRSDHP